MSESLEEMRERHRREMRAIDSVVFDIPIILLFVAFGMAIMFGIVEVIW